MYIQCKLKTGFYFLFSLFLCFSVHCVEWVTEPTIWSRASLPVDYSGFSGCFSFLEKEEMNEWQGRDIRPCFSDVHCPNKLATSYFALFVSYLCMKIYHPSIHPICYASSPFLFKIRHIMYKLKENQGKKSNFFIFFFLEKIWDRIR